MPLLVNKISDFDSGRNVRSNVLMIYVIFGHVGISLDVKLTGDQIKRSLALNKILDFYGFKHASQQK